MTVFESEAVLWDTQSGEQLNNYEVGDEYIVNAEFSPNGQKLLTVSDQAHLWEVKTGELLESYSTEIGYPNSAIFSKDGMSILITGDLTACLWSVKGAKKPVTYRGHVSSKLWEVMYSLNGERITTMYLSLIHI